MKRGQLLFAALMCFNILSLASLSLGAIRFPAATAKTISPAKAMRALGTQGWIHLSGVAPTSIQHGGAYFTFNGVGFAVDTPTQNITVTRVSDALITYTATGAGVQRILNPYAVGNPTVAGASGTYSEALKTATVTTAGAASVTLTWSPEVSEINSDLFLFYGIFGLVPLIGAAVMIYAAFNGSLTMDLAKVVVAGTVSVMIGALILSSFLR